MSWKPIETAPKNIEILVWDAHYNEPMVAERTSNFWMLKDEFIHKDKATFSAWMPIPEPPCAK